MSNRKKAVWLWLACTLLPGWCTAQSNLTPLTFFKPNREARLAVALKSKARYSAWRPVEVTVMVTNQGTTPLLINSRLLFNEYPLKGEVAFVIQDPGGKFCRLRNVVAAREVVQDDLTVLRPWETMERTVDLTETYGVKKRGKYRIQVIYYNSQDFQKDGLNTWRGSIASEPTEFEIN